MNLIVFIVVSILTIAAIGAFAFKFIGGNSKQAGMRDLMGAGNQRDFGGLAVDDPMNPNLLKERTGRAKSKKKQDTTETKLFKAGVFSAEAKRKFYRSRIIFPLITCPLIAVGMHLLLSNPMLTICGAVLGLFIGVIAPYSNLDRKIRLRQEDTLYYLPLVIEQISIGVSSALDVGPCVAHIVVMADERDSHNPVTEMLVHVERLMRSGLNLEDAMIEVGESCGMNEVKHAFMFLAQCAKHGGEISKQLQELADSVMVQRQTQVEGKITALPVKATGPLATVFAGFFALLFSGLIVRLMGAFS